ncbi:unnamed protein product, partial [Effrenium voratum]
IDDAAHMKAVHQVQEAIRAGHFYQLNFGRAWQGELQETPWELMQKLFRQNAAPYAGFLQAEEMALCCCSPELLLGVDEGRISSCPIKGTCARSLDSAEDAALRSAMVASPKEVKTLEHLKVYDPALPVGERMTGKTAVVVNRSEVVGRPVAAMLANDGAKVWSVDIDSVYIFMRGKLVLPAQDTSVEAAVREADIVILGVPSDKYKMDPSWIKEGAVVINVATTKNIDEKALLSTRPGVRYVGQIGKVTVAMLERNLLRLHQNFNEKVKDGKGGDFYLMQTRVSFGQRIQTCDTRFPQFQRLTCFAAYFMVV